MKHNLLLLLALTGVLPPALSLLKSVPHFYYLIRTKMTWPDAQTYCRRNFDDLATVMSADDWTRLQKEAQSNSFAAAAWLGLYNCINSWHWSDQNLPLQLFNKWFTTEPNNYGGHEACAAIDIYGNWWDLNCLDQKPFLCYSANFTDADRFFEISDPLKSWSDAQTYCREFYTDLATVNNNTDNSQLTGKVRSQWSAWIGLFRDGWKWSDQSNASSIRWMIGQPDNYGGDQNCAVVYNGQTSDENCDTLYPFFCHIVPPVREKQIVKLRLTTDLDMSDPVLLRSAIEELFEQKLKEQSLLENTTLTWRIQRDGNIFHKTQEKMEDSVDNTSSTSRVFSECLSPI